MKQIIENKYLIGFKFSYFKEASTFFSNQKAKRSLVINDTYGDSYYCYVCYHSLTRETEFVLSFSSDLSEDNLNFLFWENMFVLDTGKSVYLIDENLKIKTSFEIYTRVVGLYFVNKEKLLILEEAGLRVINYNGDIVKAEWLDFIEDFSIIDNLLSIQTSEEKKVIEL